jgi:dipeptidyl aminopeptidase/acylaminoacyl peptidase
MQKVFPHLAGPIAAAVALVCAVAFVCDARAQAPANVPLEAFFQNPAISAARLSPNGRFVALGVAAKNGRTQLTVLDVSKLTAKVVASFSDVDIGFFDWVNDNRLVYSVDDHQAAVGENWLQPGISAVDRDGGDYRLLADRPQTFATYASSVADPKLLPTNTRLFSTTRTKTSDDVFITQPEHNIYGDWDTVNLLRLNTRTGRTTLFNRPGKSVEWVIDAADVPRVSVTYEKGRDTVHYLDPATSQWQTIAEFGALDPKGFRPLAVGAKGDFYVTAHKGANTEALYRFDISKKDIDGEPLVSLPGFDFKGNFLFGTAGMQGLRYVSDAEATAWFDPKQKDVQQKVDAALAGTVNRVTFPLRPELPLVLVQSFSDADPGTFRLYNIETGNFTGLGTSMRGIDPRQMARRDLVRYKARDGMEIPAWLTLPRDAKGRKLPLVVLVHGGPWVRGGEWRWSADSQFLASRGYAVLEPEFRGSNGYGYKHFRAGWKQWGLAMQNDLADGARWAAAQGIADAQRICIAGASYGGYATLMGLANDADVFRCGVAWAAVTDIDLMYSVTWSDFSLDYKTYGMPRLIGDREKDAAQLKATSPLQLAAKIGNPLLLAHGGADRRVPIVHGVAFKDAVQKTNPNVEWIEYVDEGHGWSVVANRVDFWTRVQKFLDRNIGAK